MLSQAMSGLHASAPPAPAHKASLSRDSRDHIKLVTGGLEELGYAQGLAKVIAEDDVRIGLRIYLLDNSGSMQAPDGSYVQLDKNGGTRRNCTRWEELCVFVQEHADYNLSIGTPCEFVLLNSMRRAVGRSPQEGRDYIRLDTRCGNGTLQKAALTKLLQDNAPRGYTPISDRMQEIRSRITMQSRALAEKREIVFLTIVTDGLPTTNQSGDSTSNEQKRMVEEMRSISSSLPVQLVIRLCTDEQKTIELYNRIDDEMELPLDILDDMAGEAEELAKNGNGWFAYTPGLHRIREGGTLFKILDTIDERALNEQEVRQFATMLCPITDAALTPDLSNRQFIKEMQRILAGSPLVYDAMTQRMVPFVNILRLRRALKVGFRGSVMPHILPFLY